MKSKIYLITFSILLSGLFSLTPEQETISNDVMFKLFQKIYSETIKTKNAMKQIVREEPLSGLASSAPGSPFIINADITDELLAGDPEAITYLSTNDQNSWSSASTT